MTTYVYLHGFNSAFVPDNEKVQNLSQIGTVVGISYDSTACYEDIKKQLLSEINALEIDLFNTTIVGTSLGGFWAAVIGSLLGIPSVVINPCYDPTNMLRKYIGENSNYVTGVTSNFTVANCDSYSNIMVNELVYNYLPLVLIDMGDEVIDHRTTENVFNGFTVVVYQGGNHRFAHMNDAIEHVQAYSNRCSII